MDECKLADEAENEKALSDIEVYGCHILHVAEDNTGPSFSYSIGIERTSKQPELIVIGLESEITQWMINEYNSRVKNGEEFFENKLYSGFLEGFDVQFKPVQKAYYKKHFGWGIWLYGGVNFRVNQLIWPSTKGVWPWDRNAPEDYTYHQPLLYDPKD